jgi:molybdate transport system regulatory protein
MAEAKRKKTVANRVDGEVRVDKAGEAFLGSDRVRLLAVIDETGSISAAARSLGISYKGAWQAVEAMNNLADKPLVERMTGGKHGGGTHLTEEGRRTVEMFRQVEDEYQRFMLRLSDGLADFEKFNQLMRRFSMRSSARNQYLGRVSKVIKGAVNGEVELDIGDGLRIVSIITNESIEDLKLKKGREAYALIKASVPILVTDESGMRSSARNRLCGIVSTCIEGAVNGEVGITLPGNKTLTAIITNESIRSLGLKEGVEVCALIKASSVILAVHD